MVDDIPDNMEEFWEYYIGEHRLSQTRQLHIVATTVGLTLAVTGLLQGRFGLIVWGIVLSYGIAWASHFFIENNKPATFKRPILSFLCDFKMFQLALTGQLEGEVERILAKREGKL